jgi:hypothetical protein
MRARSLVLSAVLIVSTIVAGITLRRVPLGLPQGLVKYGGSVLWALMIYWIVSTARPAWRLGAVAAACTVATAVEFFKLYHDPALDAFRLTLPGALLLGRFFSVWDLIAYWLAIVVGAALDWRLRPAPARQTAQPN